jgi:hypothetical protein
MSREAEEDLKNLSRLTTSGLGFAFNRGVRLQYIHCLKVGLRRQQLAHRLCI